MAVKTFHYPHTQVHSHALSHTHSHKHLSKYSLYFIENFSVTQTGKTIWITKFTLHSVYLAINKDLRASALTHTHKVIAHIHTRRYIHTCVAYVCAHEYARVCTVGY